MSFLVTDFAEKRIRCISHLKKKSHPSLAGLHTRVLGSLVRADGSLTGFFVVNPFGVEFFSAPTEQVELH